jgi:hypothetical protein
LHNTICSGVGMDFRFQEGLKLVGIVRSKIPLRAMDEKA